MNNRKGKLRIAQMRGAGLPGAEQRVVRFGVFELDVRSAELCKHGLKVRLPNQSFQILALLLERPGELVTREELRQKLWPADIFVDFDTGLASAVKKLREALGDSAENPRFVETLPKRGYRFIVPVNGSQEAPTPRAATPAAALPQPRRLKVAVVGVAVVLTTGGAVLGLNVGRWRDRLMNWIDPPHVRSIAILPFQNLTGDSAQESLADAITDALTTELARPGLIQVGSRTSAMRFKGVPKRLPEIAAELKVDSVVEGAVSRVGERWRVSVQFIHADTDRHLWANLYERELTEIATLPNEIAWAILRVTPMASQAQEGRSPAHRLPANEKAYEAYLTGRYFWSKRGQANLAKAREYFQRAIEHDPGYAAAYAGLADSHHFFAFDSPTPETKRRAEEAARKALELDDTLAEAHVALAGILWNYYQRWAESEKELRRAIELDPQHAEAHRSLGMRLLSLRRHEEAVTALQRARELNRLDPIINIEFATALIKVGRFDEAMELLNRIREMDPSLVRVYGPMGEIHARRGEWPQAIALWEQGVARSPRQDGLRWLGYAYAISGRRREALEILGKLEKLSQGKRVSPVDFAIVHLGLGDKEGALTVLEKGFEDHPGSGLALAGPIYDLLHDEPRFQALLKKKNLPIGASVSPVSEKSKPTFALGNRK
ncbi:MAG: tetratricopeptide repeat protein [Acidobacteriales bacterium]|nr:tetratricopeptide repeat protein [Terriglobales bacterium]